MSKLVVANWKSNKTVTEATEWKDTFLQQKLREHYHFVVCPSYPLLPFILDLQEHGISLGVQDLSPYGAGAYTGEVAGYTLQQMGVEFALLGHSERRRYFAESSQTVAQKIEQALDFNITPIVCIDRDQIEEQSSLLSRDVWSKCVIAYEPVHSISTFGGQEDPLEITLATISTIHDTFGSNVPVLYGGSVDPENALTYLEQESIAGVLVGGASLDAEVFARL